MSDSIREQIITAITAKLADIQIVNGYHTDCGLTVERVRKKFDPDELPAIAVWPKTEESKSEYGSDVKTMPIQIEALQLHGTTNPSTISEKLLVDLIECIQGVEWTMDFTSGGNYTVDIGDTIVGVTSGATAYVSGVTLASGGWGEGDAVGTLTLRRVVGEFVAENLNVGAYLNIATITTGPTGTGPLTTTTNDLADRIEYESGGSNEYPDAGEQVTGVQTVFNINFSTVVGNPYAQP